MFPPVLEAETQAVAGPDRRDRLAAFIESHQAAILLAFTALYGVTSCLLASHRPMWFDELWTYQIAHLPSFSAIWSVLGQGIEYNPPLYFLLAHASQTLLGATELATRLPAVFGIWLLSVSLFFFVGRRAGAVCGFIAMLGPSFALSGMCLTEGRPAGLELGMAGLALWCWQLAGESPRRIGLLAGLAVSVAALVSVHYYAIYVVAALMLAQASRLTGKPRRLDLPVWCALLAGCTPLIFLLPMVRRLHATAGEFWAAPVPSALAESYSDLVAPSCFLICIIVAAAALRRDSRPEPPAAPRALGFPLHEWLACFYLLLMPLAIYLLAVFVTNAFWPRYVLPVAAGYSAMAAMFVARVGGAFRKLPAIVLCVGLASFAILQVWRIVSTTVYLGSPGAWVRQNVWVPIPGDLPVVIDDEQKFVQVAFYGTPEMQARAYFLNDRRASLKFTGATTIPRTVEIGRRFWPVNIVEYADFTCNHDTFYLVRHSFRRGWTIRQLLEDGAELSVAGFTKVRYFEGEETTTFLVRMPNRGPR
jgi:4-amino-4-deoxy-L-arabinose transferase-like glycosyltransferase